MADSRYDQAFRGLNVEQLFILVAMLGYIASDAEGDLAHKKIAELAMETADATLDAMGLET